MTAHVIALPFDRLPLSNNQVRRLHYRDEAKIRASIKALAVTAIRRADVKPMDRAIVTLHYRVATMRRCDVDGTQATQKSLIDALVQAGILGDDCWQYVPETRQKIHPPEPGKPAALWLELEPVEEA